MKRLVTGALAYHGSNVVPWYMGLAYTLPAEDVLVFYPLGINILMRVGRSTYHWIRYQKADKWEKELMQARQAAGPDWRIFNDKVELEIKRRFNEAYSLTGISRGRCSDETAK